MEKKKVIEGISVEYLRNEQTGKEVVQLPVDDFEELVEQLLDLPELMEARADDSPTIPWEEVKKDLGLDGAPKD